MNYIRTRLYYENPLAEDSDVQNFVLEGEAEITFPNHRMRIRNTCPEEMDQDANIVYWCDRVIPDRVELTWDFYPMADKGLCVFFFSALGKQGESIFDAALSNRTGRYEMYHSGDINAYHISYYRRMYEAERAFQLANLRKSCGFHLVAQGADPIPYPADSRPPYAIRVIKYDAVIVFYVNDLLIFSYEDDECFGTHLKEGYIGFRQMAPMIGEYANLKVYEIQKEEPNL